MDFGEILSKAWKTIWKHKVLWIFGIFASLGSGGGGGGGGGGGSNYQGNGNFSQGNGNWNFNGLPPQMQSFLEKFADTVTNIPWYVWVIIGLAFLLLFVALIVISTIGKIGLIHGTQLADKSDEKLSFGPLFSQSLRYFWRVFLFNLITGLAILCIDDDPHHPDWFTRCADPRHWYALHLPVDLPYDPCILDCWNHSGTGHDRHCGG